MTEQEKSARRVLARIGYTPEEVKADTAHVPRMAPAKGSQFKPYKGEPTPMCQITPEILAAMKKHSPTELEGYVGLSRARLTTIVTSGGGRVNAVAFERLKAFLKV